MSLRDKEEQTKFAPVIDAAKITAPFTCGTHLPPWREGWISAKRKSPQKSNRMFLLAISLQNAPPLSRSAGFILF